MMCLKPSPTSLLPGEQPQRAMGVFAGIIAVKWLEYVLLESGDAAAWIAQASVAKPGC